MVLLSKYDSRETALAEQKPLIDRALKAIMQKNSIVASFPKYQIKETGKYGKGVYAKEFIPRGTIIRVFSGDILTFDECIKRIKDGAEDQADSLQIGLELDMDLDEVSRTFNHSCMPNAGLRKISELVAIEDIQVGDQITYDYSATVGPNVTSKVWSMNCECGTKECRKKISNVLTIPTKQLRKYKKADGLQAYIVRELELIRQLNGKVPKYKRIML